MSFINGKRSVPRYSPYSVRSTNLQTARPMIAEYTSIISIYRTKYNFYIYSCLAMEGCSSESGGKAVHLSLFVDGSSVHLVHHFYSHT